MKFAESIPKISRLIEAQARLKLDDRRFNVDRTEEECMRLFYNLLGHIIRGDK